MQSSMGTLKWYCSSHQHSVALWRRMLCLNLQIEYLGVEA